MINLIIFFSAGLISIGVVSYLFAKCFEEVNSDDRKFRRAIIGWFTFFAIVWIVVIGIVILCKLLERCPL